MAKDLKYDVVVVGAGPAGSTAAEHAALNGASVLIIEQRPKVGVPVRCGEFMPSVKELRSIFPSATDLEPLFDVPKDLISMSTEMIRIYSPKLRTWEVPFGGYTTDRDRFDQHLASKAVKAGAELRTGLRCTKVEGSIVSTEEGDIEAKVVIGADGPLSLVGKCLGYGRSTDLVPTIAVQVKGDFEPIPEMYFGTVAPGGFAWIMPKKGGANVGLGVPKRFARMTVNEYFHKFMEMKGMKAGAPMGKFEPMSGPIKNTVIDNSLVVGDAAGQVMAVNGGGIPIAMICGRIAGRAAAATAVHGSPLKAYEEQWRREVFKPLNTAVHSKWLADTCFGSNWRLEMAMRGLGQRRINKLIRCKPVLP